MFPVKPITKGLATTGSPCQLGPEVHLFPQPALDLAIDGTQFVDAHGLLGLTGSRDLLLQGAELLLKAVDLGFYLGHALQACMLSPEGFVLLARWFQHRAVPLLTHQTNRSTNSKPNP